MQKLIELLSPVIGYINQPDDFYEYKKGKFGNVEVFKNGVLVYFLAGEGEFLNFYREYQKLSPEQEVITMITNENYTENEYEESTSKQTPNLKYRNNNNEDNIVLIPEDDWVLKYFSNEKYIYKINYDFTKFFMLYNNQRKMLKELCISIANGKDINSLQESVREIVEK